ALNRKRDCQEEKIMEGEKGNENLEVNDDDMERKKISIEAKLIAVQFPRSGHGLKGGNWSCPNEAKARTIESKLGICSEEEKGKDL
nr:hypothetical protein [Tanacetum cinerariifolium]